MLQNENGWREEGPVNAQISYALTENTEGGLLLRVSGNGPMPDYQDEKEQPWHAWAGRITEAAVEEGITSVGESAFSGLSAMKTISLPDSLTIIGVLSFRGCGELMEITFPEGVTNIRSKAFRLCAKLETVRFPASLETIDLRAFEACGAVRDVYYAGTEWQWEHSIVVDKSYGDNDSLFNARLHFGRIADALADFDDIDREDILTPGIVEMYRRGLISGNGRSFRPAAPADMKQMAAALYVHAGADSQYGGLEKWAETCLDLRILPEAPVTLEGMCRALRNLTRHNGFAAEECGADDVAWADGEGYLENVAGAEAAKQRARCLTRAQVCSVLAAYLSSPKSTADRGSQIAAALRRVISAGGDGRLHIAGVNLNRRGLFSKAGDCSLIVFPEGSLMLLDCGCMGTEEKLLGFLRSVGVRKLDYLAITHCHFDHTGNGPELCRYIYEECGGSIRHFWYTGANEDRCRMPEITSYLAGKGLAREDIRVDESGEREQPVRRVIDGVEITFYGPNRRDCERAEAKFTNGTANDSSLVMRMVHGKSVYLTAGDLYRDKEEYLLQTYGPEAFACTVAKANHHGNHTSSHPEWVNAIHPRLVLAETDGCGGSEIRKRYMEKSLYYATGFDGAVMISLDDKDNFTYTTQYDSNLRMNWPELRRMAESGAPV